MPEAMRVLYVLNALGGGASEGIYASLPALRERGVLPYILSPGGTAQQFERASSLCEAIRILPLPWWNRLAEHDLPRRMAMAAGRWRRGDFGASMQTAIAQIIDEWQIDLVHTGTSLTRDGALAARQMRVPHLWHIKETVGSPNRVQFPLPDSALAAYFCDHSAQVVAMSDYIAHFFRDHHCDRIAVIPDGVDVTLYRSAATRHLRRELELEDDTLLVGMVASMTADWKRHDVFVDMVALLAADYPQAHFVLLGPTPSPNKRWPYDLASQYYQRLLHYAETHVPPGRLTIYGFYADPPDMMRSLDVLVHPCDIEPFGRIAIEAMAAGTPVVGPTAGGIAETISDGETGLLVKPNTASAYAQATARLLRDSALRHRLGAAGPAHAQQDYAIDLYCERMLALYGRLTEKDGGADV